MLGASGEVGKSPVAGSVGSTDPDDVQNIWGPGPRSCLVPWRLLKFSIMSFEENNIKNKINIL